MHYANSTFSGDFFKALAFAAKAHDGQYDKAGEPYILHPIAVSSMLRNEDEQILALLHDVVEDTEHTLADVAALGFPHLTDALDCLSRRDGETYEAFISRILKNRLATKVKVADMKHNLSRVGGLPEHEHRLTERYRRWLPVLEAELCRTGAKRRTKVVAAHAGTGKTTLASRHPDKFIDFVSMPFKYHLPEGFGETESESGKADPDAELNFDFPENYLAAILAELDKSDKMLLVPPDRRLLRMLEKEGVRYILCYPENTEDAKKAYRERYAGRGNTEQFLEIFIDGWEQFLGLLENDAYGEHIVMKPHAFLTDVLDEIERHSMRPS